MMVSSSPGKNRPCRGQQQVDEKQTGDAGAGAGAGAAGVSGGGGGAAERDSPVVNDDPLIRDTDRRFAEQIVIDAIRSTCTIDSAYDDLRTIAAAIRMSGKDADGGPRHGQTRFPMLQVRCQALEGGRTNYSFQVTVSTPSRRRNGEETANDGGTTTTAAANVPATVRLYAKVTLPYSVCQPFRRFRSRDGCSTRTDNEFYIMNHLHQRLFRRQAARTNNGDDCTMSSCNGDVQETTPTLTPPWIATPYVCSTHDMKGKAQEAAAPDAKVLICQWSRHADAPFYTQFADGECDARVVAGIAQALATINSCHDMDLEFNADTRQYFLYEANVFKDALIHLAVPPPNKVDQMEDGRKGQYLEALLRKIRTFQWKNDKCVVYCQRMGVDALSRIADGIVSEFRRRDVFVHNDPHAFNILCERTTTSATSGKNGDGGETRFGPLGAFLLCDWEMAMYGACGHDTGLFLAWPLACSLAHARQGNKREAYHLLHVMIEFWDIYSVALKERNRLAEDDIFTSHHNSKSLVVDDRYLVTQFRSTMAWMFYWVVRVYYVSRIFVQLLPTKGLTQDEFDHLMGNIGYAGMVLSEYGLAKKEPNLSLLELRNRFHDIMEAEIQELLHIAKIRK